MIAEIYGKISKKGSNLSDRLEDNLTGNIFGTLRYMPFEIGLKPIIQNSVFPASISDLTKNINISEWSNNIQFWPYDREGELDAYLEFDDVVIGIEVKYESGLSSDDGADYSDINDEENEIMNSSHQLQREARIILRKGKRKRKVLLFIADAKMCIDVYQDVQRRNLFSNIDVEFGYITWQSFFKELCNVRTDNAFEKVMISDLIALLVRKNLNQYDTMNLNLSYFVDYNKYYIFDDKYRKIFNFDINNSIEGDTYYEFK